MSAPTPPASPPASAGAPGGSDAGLAPAAAELAAKAAGLRVAVIGGGIAGLVAAKECAAIGMPVTVFEAAAVPGGVVRRGEADGIVFDAGAESFATRGGHVRALLADLGIEGRIVDPAPGGAWLAGIPGVGAAPLPRGGILGIPENPFAEDVRRIIGWRGTWRAYLDRVRPPLTIGHDRSLGHLVRSRMGARVLDRLVAPVSTGVHSAHPDDIDIDAAAPGLNAALTRVGSLSGAVAELRAENAAKAGASAEAKRPGAAVQGIDGGMAVLVDALVDRLGTLGAEVRTDHPVTALERDGDAWLVHTGAGSAEGAGSVAGGGNPTDDTAPTAERFDAVILAADEETARRLLAPHVSALDAIPAGPSPRIEIVTLVLDAPALDAAPRGSGVLTVPGSHTAKALTHGTAKWPWLRASAGGRHVVRVSFGAQGEEPATAALDDDAVAALALSEASALLGVALDPAALRGSFRARFAQSQPSASLGAADRRAAAGRVIAAVPGLAAAGAWLSGTGLAQVVPHARAEAERLRHALLWG
ncbi:oxygen-dependent protoporphyrinogen oxidase [Microbacterium resistens]|uniref:Oxygen-dependent protoporphyrinogen oxidase n=1 Tax=Microbacterium resistens TaxID=156977 RepID=A0ABU1SDB6_9MICO|nr:FAD-dependent oxidoreductase [Microbacterium resistens]MDR6866887.1 oxygen-dependent protoporphyrinogen oxidase [Microbacterium resistens]